MTSPLGAMDDVNVEQHVSPLLKFLTASVNPIIASLVSHNDFELNDFEDGLDDASSHDLYVESCSYEFPC